MRIKSINELKKKLHGLGNSLNDRDFIEIKKDTLEAFYNFLKDIDAGIEEKRVLVEMIGELSKTQGSKKKDTAAIFDGYITAIVELQMTKAKVTESEACKLVSEALDESRTEAQVRDLRKNIKQRKSSYDISYSAYIDFLNNTSPQLQEDNNLEDIEFSRLLLVHLQDINSKRYKS